MKKVVINIQVLSNTEIKTQVTKDKRNRIFEESKKVTVSELYARNVFMGINQQALGVVT